MYQPKIVEEAPVHMFINGTKHITFMCSPQNLKELAIGYLYSSRNCDPALIQAIDVCSSKRRIDVSVSGELGSMKDVNAVLSSTVGSSFFTEDFSHWPAIDSSLTIKMDKAVALAEKMFEDVVLYKAHGAVHVSALSDTDKLLVLMEDIGRHNSVDKIIGYALLNNIDMKKCCIITSGRVPLDMILKVLNAQISILVSRSTPSTLAYEVAVQKGITVVGRILRGKEIFTHPHRIIENGAK